MTSVAGSMWSEAPADSSFSIADNESLPAADNKNEADDKVGEAATAQVGIWIMPNGCATMKLW